MHIVFWHETHVAILAALLRGEEPDLLEGTYRELNAEAVRRNAGESIEQLLERLLAAQESLERLAATGRALGLQVRSKAGATPRSVDGLLDRMEAHIRNHELRLRRG